MADKAIGSLVEATAINDADRFVLEQSGQAKQISGATMISELAEALDGHGGIQSIDLVGGEGNTKTYRITMTDGSSYDFSVQDGASGNYAETAGQLVSSNYTEDNTTPYVIKACESGGSNRADESLIGGTFAWNQLGRYGGRRGTKPCFGTTDSEVKSETDTSMTLNAGTRNVAYWNDIPSGHKVLVKCVLTIGENGTYPAAINFGGNIVSTGKTLQNGVATLCEAIGIQNGASYTNIYIYPSGASGNITQEWTIADFQVFDLTHLFGPTIADYIYSLAQATAGSGVAWFKKYFPKSYYAYCARALYSVNVGHKENTGTNLFDFDSATVPAAIIKTANGFVGAISVLATGVTDAINASVKYLPNTQYYIRGDITTSATNVRFMALYTDGTTTNGTQISSSGVSYLTTTAGKTVSDIWLTYGGGGNASTTVSDICINISNPLINGPYYPHETHSVIFDNTVHLRGIPKLVNGELSFEGNDTYESTGVVTRKYGIVDLGTLTWAYANIGGGVNAFYTTAITSSINPGSNMLNLRCSKYVTTNQNGLYSSDKIIAVNTSGNVYVVDSAYTDAATFKTAMSGVYLVYELAASTKETYDAFDNPQVIYDGGTNRFVDYSCENGDRDVEIPVGHSTRFLANLAGTLDSLYDRVDGDMSNIATKDAVGGTLRQLLSISKTINFDGTDYVDLGSLTWVYSSSNSFFQASAQIPGVPVSGSTGIANALCSKYPTVTNGAVKTTDKSIAVGAYWASECNVYVHDSTYGTDATAFKAAMKGVLLAYEKASS